MSERPVGRDADATLANVRAERVKRVAALAGRSARSRAGLFLVEGPQAVREAVLHAPDLIRDVYLTPRAAEKYPDIVAASSGLAVHVGTAEVLAAMSADCQGVLAVAATFGASLDEALVGTPQLVAVLANVRDPGNAGTVIRAADAAGADAVVLAGDSVDLTNPKLVRATAGSLFHLPVVRAGSLLDAAVALHSAGLTLVAADGSGEALLGSTELPERIAWVFGNEAWGLGDDDLALCDAVVRIPILGKAESLNLAAAAAVCLYASALSR